MLWRSQTERHSDMPRHTAVPALGSPAPVPPARFRKCTIFPCKGSRPRNQGKAPERRPRLPALPGAVRRDKGTERDTSTALHDTGMVRRDTGTVRGHTGAVRRDERLAHLRPSHRPKASAATIAANIFIVPPPLSSLPPTFCPNPLTPAGFL